MTDLVAKVANLACWSGPVTPVVLTGGLTNTNFVVEDGNAKYVVRVGTDMPEHLILRFNELAAARAAEKIGLSPPVVHAEEGVMVMRFIEGRTLAEDDLRDPQTLERVIPLVKQCHRDLDTELQGPVLAFWPFHVIRCYARTLRERHSRMTGELPRYLEIAAHLEKASSPTEVAFCHNDLLAANFIDDGTRMWLLDWDYAGYNSPMFDLGGLASNNRLSEPLERHLLEAYFERPLNDATWQRFLAMKCTSTLRESMWGMVSELYSDIDVDYEAYTRDNLDRFEHAWAQFKAISD